MRLIVVTTILSFFSLPAFAALQICPRMPTASSVAHQWISAISASGAVTQSQPAFTDISGQATLGQLPSIASSTVLGNVSGSSAVPSALSAAQLTSTINVFSSTLAGVVPGSGGGTTNFMRADGSWAAPPGATSGTVTSAGMSVPTFLSVSGSPITTSGTLAVSWTGLTTNGVMYATAASTPAMTAQGNPGQVLSWPGVASAPAPASIPGNSTIIRAMTVQKLLSTGTTTGWVFTISTSTTCAVGDTYTNNGNTYTVLAALSANTGQVFFASGSSSPLSSGTLTRSAGSGTASITFSASQALATYTLPTNPSPLYLHIRMVGGGGGGGGSGTSSGTVGTSGGNTLFGALLLAANGGSPGVYSGNGGGGGTSSITSPATGFAPTGGGGAPGKIVSNTTQNDYGPGGNGGVTPFGGAGSGNAGGGVGVAATTNSGSGGGGAGSQSSGGGTASLAGGGGGGAGGFIDAYVSSPSSTYVYAIGSAGSAQAAGTGGSAGGAGSTGIILVEEHYQ
jgi:hypothetical protein